MKNILPAFVFILVIMSSCKKEQDTIPQAATTPVDVNRYIDENIYPYKFKQGTYWVYQNDSTGILDSLFTDSVSTGFFVSTPGVHGAGSIETEYYKMHIHDVSASLYFNQMLHSNVMSKNFSGDWSNGFHGQPVYQSNSAVGEGYSGMMIYAKFLSMTVNSHTFDHVDEVKITAAEQPDPQFDHDTYLYYCDSVGLIKKEIVLAPGNIESWSLKRWHVIR